VSHGVDIWSKKDQSGKAKDVALRNASLEGVSDRVHEVRSCTGFKADQRGRQVSGIG